MRVALSVLLLLFLIPPWMGEKQLPLLGKTAEFDARPVALDIAHRDRRRVGQLTWLGGVQLKSFDPAFGGFSAMHVESGKNGDRLTLLSDGGNIVTFGMDRQWQITDRGFAELPGGPGTGWAKYDRDSESMAVDLGTGRIWVGFERANGIWRFSPRFERVEGHVQAPVMAGWPTNAGPEAMVRLARGGFVVLSEGEPWPDERSKFTDRSRAALYFRCDPTERPRSGFRFSYVPPDRYDPSDVAELPDGRLLVLNRRFSLPFDFAVKLTVIDPKTIRPGALVRGREIATLEKPLIHDNFEGLAVTREGAATIIWLVSDDNQLFLQRSLLLKFRLEPDPPRRRR